MKGLLNKTEVGWVVSFNDKSLLLHPDDVNKLQKEYDYYGAIGFKSTNVDFEVVEGKFGGGGSSVWMNRYANLTSESSMDLSNHFIGSNKLVNMSEDELEREILNLLYVFEYEEIPNSSLYKFDFEGCAKELVNWYNKKNKTI
jgi:hypothetical protein